METLKKSSLKGGYSIFGNRSAVSDNACHIKVFGADKCLCGASALAVDWSIPFNVDKVGCSVCAKEYLRITSPIKKKETKKPWGVVKTHIVKKMESPIKSKRPRVAKSKNPALIMEVAMAPLPEKVSKPKKGKVVEQPVITEKQAREAIKEMEKQADTKGAPASLSAKKGKKTMAMAVTKTKTEKTVKLPKESYPGENDLKATKGVTSADIKFVETYIADAVRRNPERTYVFNAFSKEGMHSTPLINRLCAFVYDLNDGKLKRWGVPEGRMIQLFDRARYLILKLDSKVYSTVID